MATQSAESMPLLEFAAALLREREVAPRARLIVQQMQEALPGCAVVLYTLTESEPQEWRMQANVGEITLESGPIAADAGTLGALTEKGEALLFASAEVAREDYAHLNIRKSFQSLGYLPVIRDDKLLGAIEIVSYDQPLTEEEVAPAAELLDVAAIALDAALAVESQNHSNLQSIARLTELYDIELVFNGTLEMDELMPLITSKIKQLMNVQAVNLWMVSEGDQVQLMSAGGADVTVAEGESHGKGANVPADVADTGEPVLLEDATQDERMVKRNGDVEEGAIFSLLAVPVIDKDHCVGVLEAINRMDGQPFDDDDQFLLTTIAEAAAVALHNANLLFAERKVEILETLVKVSTEITSTLDLNRVLLAIVNGTQSVIPYERAAIALEKGARTELMAVLGEEELNKADPQTKRLGEMLEWASLAEQELHIRMVDDEIDDPRPETQAKFKEYFEATGLHAFYSMPLADDQGRLGVFSLESSDPDFLLPVHKEVLKVLGGQATVALRNAALYREVPFIGVLEPILQRKQQFMRMPASKRRARLILWAAVAVFLVLCPWPMRVEGDAFVGPARQARVQPEVEGVVASVLVREGQKVDKNEVLAQLEDWPYRSALAAATAKYGIAASEMNRALAANDTSTAGLKRVEADYWSAEKDLAQQRLEKTRLRSPIAGVVATPHVENFVGKHLDPGEAFADVIDTQHAIVDVNVDEKDVRLVRAGNPGAINLDGFPTQIFRGELNVVSTQAKVDGEQRTFAARVMIDDPNGALRPGMQGKGKISTSWRPAGYVLFRRPAMWAWSKLWSWVGW
ncbi:MAG: efflux RND transporter periplasmic adaptor subunit [Acidobacteriales bacterium]|nr:efflux RND transporter periplasmic adaptor subunit [Terriglobales bacterium]